MSKFGFNIGASPTGLADILRATAAAHSPIPIVFALGHNIASVRNEYSPTTKIVYRDQRFGADNGAMYQGTPEQAHLAGHAWAAKLIPIWRLNQANFYSHTNEPGVNTPEGLRWLSAFNMGVMDEVQENGLKVTIGGWSLGNPPLDAASIEAIVPMFRQAAQNGHIAEVHEYSQHGPMQGSPFALRYRQLYAALPEDAQPPLVIAEASSGAGYGTALFGQAWVDDMGWYDQQTMPDRWVIGFCTFRYGQGESNLTEVIPLIQEWIINHPTPIESGPTVEERLAYLESAEAANRTAHAKLLEDQVDMAALLIDLNLRVTVLENEPPQPQETTVTLDAYPTTVTQGQAIALTWRSEHATSITSNFGAVGLAGTMSVTPAATTRYTITAHGALNEATAGVDITVNPAPQPIIFQWRGVGVGDNQPLTTRVTSAFEISKVDAVKLFTMPDETLMNAAINAIKAKRPEAFIMARLFFSVNPLSRFSPTAFVAFCQKGLQAAYAAGVRYFEIHNEPNLESEGFGFNWANGAQFGTWLQGVLAIVKPLYPLAKWGYPGLSPQPNTVPFLTDSLAAAQACDWIGAHAYFTGLGDKGFGMTSIDGGFHWKRIRDLVPGKPLIITEFSCNTTAVDYTSKGNLYRQYYDLIKIEPGVLGAFCFALSWPGSDPNREGWVYGDKVTPIPAALGAV